jgi:hypothetical protein
MRSFFDKLGQSEINPPAADCFLYPIFQYYTIPLFHWMSKSKHRRSGVKSKLGPLGPDSLLALVKI